MHAARHQHYDTLAQRLVYSLHLDVIAAGDQEEFSVHSSKTSRHDDDDDTALLPFVSVDEARERPKTVDANAPDVGGVADDVSDTSVDVEDDDDRTDKEDGLHGDDTAIYQRGATLMPPS